MPGQRGESDRMTSEHAVQEIVGRDDLEQPGDCGAFELLAARGMYPCGPARRYILRHGASLSKIEQVF
jgi:hypothetical protein